MRKKPLLGLVGLCVGLTLSGCKDCGCNWGWGSRKDPGPPTARVQNKDTGTQTVSENSRTRTITDHSVANKGVDPSRVKPAFDHPKDSYRVPTLENVGSPYGKTDAVETRKVEEQVLAEPKQEVGKTVPTPIAPTVERKTNVPASDEDLLVPKPPMTIGDLQGKTEVVPVEKKVEEVPAMKEVPAIKEVPAAKLPAESESTVTIPSPEPPAPPASYKATPSAPVEKAPAVETPVESSAPELTTPPEAPMAPTTPPASEPSEKKGEPELELPPPPPPPSK